MESDYIKFFKVKMPNKGYYCPNGNDKLHNEYNLSFECGCGHLHQAKEALALIMFPLENKTLYLCPENKGIFTLVRPKGWFRIKGLKTVATYSSKNDEEIANIMADIERRKRKS